MDSAISAAVQCWVGYILGIGVHASYTTIPIPLQHAVRYRIPIGMYTCAYPNIQKDSRGLLYNPDRVRSAIPRRSRSCSSFLAIWTDLEVSSRSPYILPETRTITFKHSKLGFSTREKGRVPNEILPEHSRDTSLCLLNSPLSNRSSGKVQHLH